MARRKASRSRRASRQGGWSAGSVAAAVALLIGIVAILAGGAYLYVFKVDHVAYDAETLCPQDGPVAHLALLLDTTDPVSRAQMGAARSFINEEIAAAAPGTMISLAVVSEDPSVRGEPEVVLCKPRSGADASELYENPTLIRRRYEERFEEPLQRKLDSLMTAEAANASPIMESLQAQVSLTPGFRTFDGPRRLVIFSDLLQHSDVLSVYRGQDWGDLAGSGGESRLAKSLSGVEVLLLRVTRPTGPGDTVDDLWVNYFDAQGAGPVRVRTIGDL